MLVPQLEEVVAEGHKAIVFSQFHQVITADNSLIRKISRQDLELLLS
ncbi:MAG: hypothetical protein ACT4OM_00030 [Actinomycetota bacterium]